MKPLSRMIWIGLLGLTTSSVVMAVGCEAVLGLQDTTLSEADASVDTNDASIDAGDADGNSDGFDGKIDVEAGRELAISFVAPTPQDQATVKQSSVPVSVKVDSAQPASAFINFNQSVVGYWSFDEGSGIEAKDLSGYVNHGKIEGQATWVKGRFGAALLFGAAGTDVLIHDDPSLNLTGPITIEAWIRPSKAQEVCGGGPNGSHGILSKGNKSQQASWQLRYGNDDDQCYLGFQFVDYHQHPKYTWASIGQPLESGQWYHVAATYDGETLNSYLNGSLTQSVPLASYQPSPAPILIGDDGWGNKFQGAVDEVRIHKRALSANEIAASYDARSHKISTTFSGLANDTYTYSARVTDASGGRAETEARTVTVDAPPCGDGHLDALKEQCDDGNTTAGDGCAPDCTREDGWFCHDSPSVCERFINDSTSIVWSDMHDPVDAPAANIPSGWPSFVGGHPVEMSEHNDWTSLATMVDLSEAGDGETCGASINEAVNTRVEIGKVHSYVLIGGKWLERASEPSATLLEDKGGFLPQCDAKGKLTDSQCTEPNDSVPLHNSVMAPHINCTKGLLDFSISRVEPSGYRSVRPAYYFRWDGTTPVWKESTPSTVQAIFSVVYMRLVLDDATKTDDRSKAKYVGHLVMLRYNDGCSTAPCKTGSYGSGRFKYVTTSWQPFHFAAGSIATNQSELAAHPPPLPTSP